MIDREALAFDMYGTLVDPLGIRRQLEHDLPGDAPRVAEIWRQKQLEYTFRLTAMGRYEDFAAVTRKALAYALAAAGRDLDRDRQGALLARYDDLEPFADVHPGLRRLRATGHAMVVFSNGTPAMLGALMDSAGLRPYFDGVVSVDEVRTYKPAPVVYQHVAARLDRPPDAVRLISSNPFDIVGAEAAGLRTAWVDRAGGPFDTLGPRPALVVATLTALADALAARDDVHGPGA